MGKAGSVTRATPEAEGALDPRDAVLRVRDAAKAVEAASGQGEDAPRLPENLLTSLGRAAGASPYRAPEVRDGGALDEAGAVYSLGSLLYALIVGHEPDPHSPQPPFQFDARVPDDLEILIRAAMHVDAKRRPGPAVLAAALSDWLDRQRAPEPRSAAYPPAWIDALVISGLIALLLGGLAWPATRGHGLASRPVPRRVSTLAPAATGVPPPVAPKSKAWSGPEAAHVQPQGAADVSTPALPPPARVGTVKYVHREYGVFVALEAPAAFGVGDSLEAVRDGIVVAALTVRQLSGPEMTYPYGAAVCDASAPRVDQERLHPGNVVRRPKR